MQHWYCTSFPSSSTTAGEGLKMQPPRTVRNKCTEAPRNPYGNCRKVGFRDRFFADPAVFHGFCENGWAVTWGVGWLPCRGCWQKMAAPHRHFKEKGIADLTTNVAAEARHHDVLGWRQTCITSAHLACMQFV